MESLSNGKDAAEAKAAVEKSEQPLAEGEQVADDSKAPKTNRKGRAVGSKNLPKVFIHQLVRGSTTCF